MPQQATFGRRAAPAKPAYGADRLSPQAEAFRAALSEGQGGDLDEFGQWRRSQRPRRRFVIALGLVFMTPGLLCFLLNASLPVSIGMSLAGLAVNAWLRRERQRQAKDIAQWAPPEV